MSNAPIKNLETDDSTPEIDLRDPRWRRVVRSRKGKERIPIRGLREALGKTQEEIATILGTDQGEISRIERRPDVLLSTLRRYAAALGATCEVTFVLPNGSRALIADPEPSDPPK